MASSNSGNGTSSSSSSNVSSAHPELSATSPRNKSALKTSTTTGVSTSIAGASALSEPSAAAGYPSSTSAAALASLGANASPTDVLLTLPPPVLRLLVVSAPFISFLTTTTQLLTWTHPNRYAPFFLPVLWTALCLGGERISRYGLNGLLLSILSIGWIVRKGAERRRLKNDTAVLANRGVAATASKDVLNTTNASGNGREGNSVRTLVLATPNQPAVQVLTPAALNLLLAESTTLSKHIQILHHTFSPLFKPFTWQDPDLSWATIYFLMNSYPFYLVLTTLVSMRSILLVLGLVALLWEAPWFAVVRRSLWKSAFIRKTARVGIRVLSGGAPSMRFSSIRGPQRVGMRYHWDALKQIWRDTKADVTSAQSAPQAASRGQKKQTGPGKNEMVVVKSADRYEHDIVEVQYMFTIFENQRWWIGLEWTQALLPNERPSWSDPTHSPCSPPGSFALPPATTVHLSATKKRTFTWKWSDPEWRIRGTAGVMISPSTIGANPNPVNTSNTGVASGTAAATAASMGDKAAKDLKDVMGSLGDWKSMLANRRDNSDKDRRSSGIVSSAVDDKPASPSPASTSAGNSHIRKGSTTSFLGDSFNAFVGAIDGKPVSKDSPASPIDMDGKKAGLSEAAGESSRQAVDPKDDPDLIGHPTRIDDTGSTDVEFKTWEVDSQGWVYSDNQWEKTTSKGGMGRYTRRRAWVRRAIVVETTEDIDAAQNENLSAASVS